jgi:peptide/nickel transport system substrate-binding protein
VTEHQGSLEPSLEPHEELRWFQREIGRRGLLKGLGGLAAAGSVPWLLSACTGTVGSTAGSKGSSSISSLTYLASDVPDGFDWDGPDAAVPTTQFGMDQCFGRLVQYKLVEQNGLLVPDFNQLEGQLAESWTQNGLIWTFNLRQGVKSPAGNEFTADDVVWLAARAKSVSGASPIAWFLYNVSSVMGAENVAPNATAADKQLSGEVVKIDTYTVQIKQLTANRLFPGVMSIFAMSMIDSTEAKKHATASDPWVHNWVNTSGATTAGYGPYRLQSLQNDHSATFVTNPGWNVSGLTQPTVQTVTMNKVPQTSVRVGAMEAGGGTKVTDDLTSRDWETLEQNSNVRVFSLYGNQNTFLFTNFSIKPFDNQLVRQAFAYAMPYDEITSSVYFGNAKRWLGCVPSSYPGYKEISIYGTNIPKAKQLLAQAGYPDGKGLSAFSSAMTLYYVAEKADQLQPLATLVQTALAQINANITLSPIPQSEYGQRQLVSKNLPFAIDDQEKPIAADAGYAIQLFFVTGSKGGLNNMMNYSNPQVDNLWLNDAKTDPDTASRDATLATIQEIIMADVAWIPLVEYETQVAGTTNLTDYAFDPDNSIRMVDWKQA